MFKIKFLQRVILLVLFSGVCGPLAQAQTFEYQERDFKTLFNTYRFAQPEIVPWAGSFYSYANNGIDSAESAGGSPAALWDRFNGNPGSSGAAAWERKNHTCEHLTGADKEGCKGWWGHCNAWSSAAIKHPEPRASVNVLNSTNMPFTFGVGQQKALLTELWMESGSLFLGTTDKGSEVTESLIYANPSGLSASQRAIYNAYWDVTPRALVLTFMNYIGVKKVGVVIDRYTGSQVWNQPISGYRILPIRQSDLKHDGRTALIRMKIFWANDSVQTSDHVSSRFSIRDNTQDVEGVEELGESYHGRLLRFYLNFDKPLQLNSAGTAITNSVNIVDDGTWYHQLNRETGNRIFHQHPDFIWAPTQVFTTSSGYRNPYVQDTNLAQHFKLQNTT